MFTVAHPVLPKNTTFIIINSLFNQKNLTEMYSLFSKSVLAAETT